MVAIVGHEDALAKACIEREQFHRSRRQNWETLWQSCAIYGLPREANFNEQVTPGHERTRQILDTTAPRSLELFASFLHTLMNNPGQQWFKLRIDDPGQKADKIPISHKQWLEFSEKVTLQRMVKAKVYEQLHQAFIYLGCFGTAVVYVEFIGGRLRIRHFHLGDCIIEQGEDGEVDAIYRQMFLTPRQAAQRWGADASETISKGLKQQGGGGMTGNRQGPGQDRYLHCVFPMNEPELSPHIPDALRRIGSLIRPGNGLDGAFASVWVDTKAVKTLSVGHYHEFPYMVPRWYQANDEVYGRGPMMSMLPSVRMANRMLETILRGAEKLVDPPMMLPEGGLLSPLRLFPGSITFSDGAIKPEPLVPPGASRIEMGNALLEKVQSDIERGFFVPLFVDVDDKVKTATQVLQEADERHRAVSPMLMRTQTELYDPFVKRTFNVLHRGGVIPEPPEGLDASLSVEYVSPLIASQRQAEGLSIMRLFESLAPWHGVDPRAFDSLDTDRITAILHRATGAPADVFRGEQAVKRLRAERQAQEQAAQQAAMLEQGAGAAADLMTAAAKAQG